MRPTGKLHLGNLHGALRNWIELQNSGIYDCFYFVADWHAITSEYNATEDIKNNITSMMVDWLAPSGPAEEHFIRAISGERTRRIVFNCCPLITLWLGWKRKSHL